MLDECSAGPIMSQGSGAPVVLAYSSIGTPILTMIHIIVVCWGELVWKMNDHEVRARHLGNAQHEKGLQGCNSPMCTLSQNGYGEGVARCRQQVHVSATPCGH